MNYKNVRFKWGNGKFVESSKEKKEGFEKVEYEDLITKENKVTYHKYHDFVEGVISSVGINETSFGTFLRVNVKTGKDEITSIQVPYKDTYGYSRETKAFISSLRGYEIGKEVKINPVVNSFTRKNGKEGKDINFYINYKDETTEDGKSISTGYIAFNEIPPLEVEEKRGEKTYNNDKQMDYYYNILETVINNFSKYWDEVKASKPSNENETPSNKETANADPVGNSLEFNEDDLPF